MTRPLFVSIALHAGLIGVAVGLAHGTPVAAERIATRGFWRECAAAAPIPAVPLPDVPILAEPEPEPPPVAEYDVPSVLVEPTVGSLPDPGAEDLPPMPSPTLARIRAAAAPSPTPVPDVAPPMTPPTPVAVAAARVLTVRAGTNRPPDYPAAARRRGCTGTVLLELEVDATGAVVDVRIGRSSGHRVLDAAAAMAVRRWRFDGGPGRIEVPIEFVLR